MDYLALFLTLLAGFSMGVGSRFIIKQTLADYVDTKIKDLNTVTSTYTNKVQIQCDKIVEDAQEKAINIYKEALTEAAEVVFRHEKDLN